MANGDRRVHIAKWTLFSWINFRGSVHMADEPKKTESTVQVVEMSDHLAASVRAFNENGYDAEYVRSSQAEIAQSFENCGSGANNY